jgi:hypothetical protein
MGVGSDHLISVPGISDKGGFENLSDFLAFPNARQSNNPGFGRRYRCPTRISEMGLDAFYDEG